MPETLSEKLRRTTEAMANTASVPMLLWSEHSNACLDAANELAESHARIEAAKKRVGDLKAVHSRWYDGHDRRQVSDILSEIEGIAYSVRMYLDGVPGLYRTDAIRAPVVARHDRDGRMPAGADGGHAGDDPAGVGGVIS